jgi:alkanesulfonate monooxygenase SsuD/methylene tetrahydromethanopterin reductase-like flavin-dependent oxidoreductase (luciferase family)
MEIGIGLPNAIQDVDSNSLLEFAKKADARGFSSLGSVDRIAYPNFEPVLSLAAVATITERIRLATTVLLGPLRPNTVLLAKELATLDNLSGGRFWLGIGLGAREDDYGLSGIPTKGRGATLDRQLEQIKDVWEGDDVGPKPTRPGGPEIMVGGSAAASYERAARYGSGWIMGGGTPEMFADGAKKTDEAWERAGRSDKPRKASLAYFSLGPDAQAHAERNLGHYYAWLGDYAAQIVGSTATSSDMVKSYIEGFEQAGCDELILFPASKHPEQVDLLADAVGK